MLTVIIVRDSFFAQDAARRPASDGAEVFRLNVPARSTLKGSALGGRERPKLRGYFKRCIDHFCLLTFCDGLN